MGAPKANYRVKDIWERENPGIDKKSFSAFVTECNHALMRAAIMENIIINLPSMGSLQIKKIKPKVTNEDGTIRKKGLKVDFGATRKMWAAMYPGLSIEEIKRIEGRPIVYHTNKHSNGYVYKVKWDTLTTTLPGKSCYEFRMARQHTRFLSAMGQDPNVDIDFYEIK